ncbi:MAG: macro domain-containing protein [Bradymonadia bacterium]
MVEWVLVDLEWGLYQAWREAFADVDAVTVVQGSIFEQGAGALVSPANSFGFMDGSLDLRLSEHLGWHVERRVRERLFELHDGELPVGCAEIVATDHPEHPWLISAPTMRVPMDVSRTANAFLAFKAVLKAIKQHNHGDQPPITRVLCPGLGTGCGFMPFERCALQMRRAWAVFMEGQVLVKGGLAAAAREHMAFVGDDG